MTIRYVIRMSDGSFCNCFSAQDVLKNLRFCWREYPHLSVVIDKAV